MWTVIALGLVLADDPPIGGKELPLATKPMLKVALLAREKPVQVSEYRSKTSTLVTRVYRYSLRGDYKSTVSRLQRDLPPKEGWRSAPTSTVETDFWRTSKSGPVAQVGLIVQQARLVREPKVAGGWRALPASQSKGWLWISYNEVSRP